MSCLAYDDVAATIRRAIALIVGVDPDEQPIPDDLPFIADSSGQPFAYDQESPLPLDSLDALELGVAVEEIFNIQIEPMQEAWPKTVRELADFIIAARHEAQA